MKRRAGGQEVLLPRSRRKSVGLESPEREVTPRVEPVDAVHFRARVEINGVNPFVWVEAAQATQLNRGWRRPMPVRGTIVGRNEATCRINLMPAGDGRFYLYLDEGVRAAGRFEVGDEVTVRLVFDADYRGGPAAMPPLLAEGLQSDGRAREGWESLSPSRQKEVVRYLGKLRSQPALIRNVARALGVLAGNGERFLGRQWAARAEGGPPKMRTKV